MSPTTTTAPVDYYPDRPIVDTKQIASEPAVFAIEITRIQRGTDGTVLTDRMTVGTFATRRRAESQAVLLRMVVNDSFYAGQDSMLPASPIEPGNRAGR